MNQLRITANILITRAIISNLVIYFYNVTIRLKVEVYFTLHFKLGLYFKLSYFYVITSNFKHV